MNFVKTSLIFALIKRYEWFVKIDMDTLLLPENLKALLKNEGEDYKQVVMWGDPIPGPCEVFSQGALKAFGARHKDECDGGSLDMRKEWPQEDMLGCCCSCCYDNDDDDDDDYYDDYYDDSDERNDGEEALGSRNVEPRGDWRFDGHLTSNAKTLEQLKAGNKLVCYSEPGAPDSSCISREDALNWVAFHPLKNPKHMEIVSKWITRPPPPTV
eukprot:jgi/Bigna1/128937/aug1.7_g3645